MRGNKKKIFILGALLGKKKKYGLRIRIEEGNYII